MCLLNSKTKIITMTIIVKITNKVKIMLMIILKVDKKHTAQYKATRMTKPIKTIKTSINTNEIKLVPMTRFAPPLVFCDACNEDHDLQSVRAFFR